MIMFMVFTRTFARISGIQGTSGKGPGDFREGSGKSTEGFRESTVGWRTAHADDRDYDYCHRRHSRKDANNNHND